MKKFWNFKNETGTNILTLEGIIEGDDLWLENNGTAQQFKSELAKCNGDITVKINSMGGDCFAAADIYSALKEYHGKVRVEIIALAASAASVIAMAGDEVCISPVGAICIHNPFTATVGDSAEMLATSRMLDEVKETIINAYELKTKLPREKIAQMMTDETWMNAKKALELGFVDKILYTDETAEISDAVIFSRNGSAKKIMNQLIENYRPTTQPILPNPINYRGETTKKKDFGYPQDVNYHREFLNAIGKKFKVVDEVLREGYDNDGGFLLPSEMHDQLITELTQENILRQICSVIQTQSAHKITIVSARPAASWVKEAQEIQFSNESFSQISLDAYKLAIAIKVTNELLQDSFYDIENHLVEEFGRAIGNAEENAFINGSPDTDTATPTGLLTVLNADTDAAITTTSAQMDTDDIIELVYNLEQPYRKNACFLMNDATLARIRKLKSVDLNYMWQPSITEGEPTRLLGYPVYTTANFPAAKSSGDPLMLFGDFSRVVIGDRAVRTFKPLRELYAMSDCTAFLMIERVDCVLADKKAIKLLKLR